MRLVEPDSGTRVADGPEQLEVTVPTSADELTGLRRRVRRLAIDAGASKELSSDLELAVSELATNVIRHTHAPTMRVAVRVDREGDLQHWTVQVDNDVLPTPIDAEPVTDAPGGGRGLRIVAAIMDDITVTERHGRMTITASRAVSE